MILPWYQYKTNETHINRLNIYITLQLKVNAKYKYLALISVLIGNITLKYNIIYLRILINKLFEKIVDWQTMVIYSIMVGKL